jgi:hypothetical protein
MILEVLAQVTVEPDPGGLPGSEAVQNLINGLQFYALLAVVAAFLAGCGLMAFGSLSSNPRSSAIGKATTIVALLAAFGIGAAAAIVNFFYNAGGGVS